MANAGVHDIVTVFLSRHVTFYILYLAGHRVKQSKGYRINTLIELTLMP